MVERDKALANIFEVKELLKQREREHWNNAEREQIEKRGETDVDFFRISFKLAVLDRMENWVYKYGKLTNSQKAILKNYRRI